MLLRLSTLITLITALSVLGCAKSSTPQVQANAHVLTQVTSPADIAKKQNEVRQWRQEAKRTRVSAALFPQATKVVLYANPFGISVDPSGKPNLASYPAHGLRISDDEIKTLRHSVFYAPPPPLVVGCCSPRHAFLFYDKHGKYLGELSVCFECGCASFTNETPPSEDLRSIEWDYAAIKNIVRAHQLRVYFDRNDPEAPDIFKLPAP